MDDLSRAMIALLEAERPAVAYPDVYARSSIHASRGRGAARTGSDEAAARYAEALSATTAALRHHGVHVPSQRHAARDDSYSSSLSDAASSASTRSDTHAFPRAPEHGWPAMASAGRLASPAPPARTSFRDRTLLQAQRDESDESDDDALQRALRHTLSRDDADTRGRARRVALAMKMLMRESSKQRHARAPPHRGMHERSASPPAPVIVNGHTSQQTPLAQQFHTLQCGTRILEDMYARSAGDSIEAAYRAAFPAASPDPLPVRSPSRVTAGARRPPHSPPRSMPVYAAQTQSAHSAAVVGLLGELKRLTSEISRLHALLAEERQHSAMEARARVHAETMLSAMQLYRHRVLSQLEAAVPDTPVGVGDAWFTEALRAAVASPRPAASTSVPSSTSLFETRGALSPSYYSMTARGPALPSSAQVPSMYDDLSAATARTVYGGDVTDYTGVSSPRAAIPAAVTTADSSPARALRALRLADARYGDSAAALTVSPPLRLGASLSPEPTVEALSDERIEAAAPAVDFAVDDRRELGVSLDFTMNLLEEAARRAAASSNILASARSVYE